MTIPCPYCGGFHVEPVEDGERGAVQCASCGAIGPDVELSGQGAWIAEALRRWNERKSHVRY